MCYLSKADHLRSNGNAFKDRHRKEMLSLKDLTFSFGRWGHSAGRFCKLLAAVLVPLKEEEGMCDEICNVT